MFRARSISLCFAVALLASVCARAAEPPWLELHSAHFNVVTDAGEKRGREVAFRFEQMRAVFANLLSKDRLNQPVPLTILALANDESFYRVAPLHDGKPLDAPGFLLRNDDQDFIVLNLAENEPWRGVAHDFALMLLDYNYPPTQGWFDEGLAEYFSSIRLDNKQIEIGRDPELHPATNANSAASTQAPAGSLTERLTSETWIPVPDLFAAKHDATSTVGGCRTLYCAESWVVMHYLLHEKKLPETGTYFGLALNLQVPISDAIQKAYGMTVAQFEQTVRDYFHSQSSEFTASGPTSPATVADIGGSSNLDQAYRFPTPVGADDSAIISSPLPESDAKALYAEVAIRIPERRDAGLKELQTLATTPTPADQKAAAKAENSAKKDANSDASGQLPSDAIGNAMAHRVLAWDHIEHGEFDEALVELGDAAALSPRDMWVRYYLCRLKYQMAQARHTDIQGLANMLLDLRTVLEWYPELADAYDLLAMARNEGGTPTEAMRSERAAMMLRPRDELYAYHIALIYIAAKKWEAAQAQLTLLKGNSDAKIAALATQQLDQMQTERKYGLVGSNAPQQKLEPQKSPFDVLDADEAKREAAEKTEQSAGQDMRPTKFFRGRLVDVDCSQSPAAILTIASGRSEMKLRAADYRSLLLIGADSFSCAWHDVLVDANYKPGGTADGDLVSLEVH
ncbi:MAG TPA: hypothetical protein VMG31_03905 [Verrucomicrobiae bacterium]|nr:hypothetical protein [Verrucomicrobiae bacterium]